MANAFDKFDKTENAFDQFDSQPIAEVGSVLPDFMNITSQEDVNSQVEMIKANPEGFGSTLIDSSRIGLGRGLQDFGEGIKQLALQGGEFIGRNERGSTKDYTKQVEDERSQFDESYGVLPTAKISRFIGSNAPYAAIPLKMPTGLFNKVLTGSTFGEVVGGTQFVPEGGSRQGNILAGSVVGGGIPLGGAIGSKMLKPVLAWADSAMIQPFTQKGMYRDVAKFLKKEITENRPKIEKAIQDSINKGENKTVAQIIAETTKGSGEDFGGMLIKLEKDLSKESDALKSIYALASKKQTDVLDKIAGTSDELTNAINLRSSNADKLYTESYKTPVNIDPKLAQIAKNKFFRNAMKDANALAEAEGITAKDNLTQYLHYVKEGLDKQLNVTDAVGKSALGKTEQKVIQRVKTDLVEWLEKKNPTYNEARLQFQKDSIPINKMEIGNELKKAYSSALDSKRPVSFASSIRDINKTVKNATGFKKNKGLSGVLEPDEISNLSKIVRELKTDAVMKKSASESKAILPKLSGETTISLPHILSRPVVITNHALRLLGKDKTPAYRKLLIDLVKDPKKFIEAYRLPSETKPSTMATDIIQKLAIIGGAQENGN